MNIDPSNFNLGELTTYQVGAMQAAAIRSLRKHGDELLSEYGITNMQWHIIGTILDAGRRGMRISDLAKQLDTTMSFMTTNVNLLESKWVMETRQHQP